MKICSKCAFEKPESEYFLKDKSTGRRHAQCKQCYQQHRQTYHLEHYKKYRAAYLERAKLRREKLRDDFHEKLFHYLSGKSCEVCGETDICVLEFDHLEPADKLFNISQAVKQGYSWDKTLIEIKKCRILCANCHKRHTASQFNWYKAKLDGGTYRI